MTKKVIGEVTIVTEMRTHTTGHAPAQCLTRRIPPPVQSCWLCAEAGFPSLSLISLRSSSVLDGNEHMCEQAAAT